MERAVEAKIEKTDCFVKNEIFSVSDRTEHALSPIIYRTAKDSSSVEYTAERQQKARTAKRTVE